MTPQTAPPRPGNLDRALAGAARFGGRALIACGELIAVSLMPSATADVDHGSRPGRLDKSRTRRSDGEGAGGR